MREIQFRAWYPEKQKMYEVAKVDMWGDPEQATCDLAAIDEELFDLYLHEVEIMQYTGLKDKNGKKIYEGDIIYHENLDVNYCGATIHKVLGTVVIENGMTYVVGKSTQEVYNSDTGKSVNSVSDYKCFILSKELFEIIGNIHDNPELLEEELK